MDNKQKQLSLKQALEDVSRFNRAAEKNNMGAMNTYSKRDIGVVMDMFAETGDYVPVEPGEVLSLEKEEIDNVTSNELWHNKLVWDSPKSLFKDSKMVLIADSSSGVVSLWEGGGKNSKDGLGQAVIITGSDGKPKSYLKKFDTSRSVNREHAMFPINKDDLVVISYEGSPRAGLSQFCKVYTIESIDGVQLHLSLIFQSLRNKEIPGSATEFKLLADGDLVDITQAEIQKILPKDLFKAITACEKASTTVNSTESFYNAGEGASNFILSSELKSHKAREENIKMAQQKLEAVCHEKEKSGPFEYCIYAQVQLPNETQPRFDMIGMVHALNKEEAIKKFLDTREATKLESSIFYTKENLNAFPGHFDTTDRQAQENSKLYQRYQKALERVLQASDPSVKTKGYPEFKVDIKGVLMCDMKEALTNGCDKMLGGDMLRSPDHAYYPAEAKVGDRYFYAESSPFTRSISLERELPLHLRHDDSTGRVCVYRGPVIVDEQYFDDVLVLKNGDQIPIKSLEDIRSLGFKLSDIKEMGTALPEGMKTKDIEKDIILGGAILQLPLSEHIGEGQTDRAQRRREIEVLIKGIVDENVQKRLSDFWQCHPKPRLQTEKNIIYMTGETLVHLVDCCNGKVVTKDVMRLLFQVSGGNQNIDKNFTVIQSGNMVKVIPDAQGMMGFWFGPKHERESSIKRMLKALNPSLDFSIQSPK